VPALGAALDAGLGGLDGRVLAALDPADRGMPGIASIPCIFTR
jgi:hypothetical protein